MMFASTIMLHHVHQKVVRLLIRKHCFAMETPENEKENGGTEKAQSESREKEGPWADKSLPPSDWSPEKKSSDQDMMQKHDASNSPRKYLQQADNRKKLSYEEIIVQLEDKIKALLRREDFTTLEARGDLKFVQRQTRYSPDVVLNRRIVERIVKYGIAHVFLRVWQCVSQVDILSPEKFASFKNLQTILSVIWNCSDKSPYLCECLVRCGVIQQLLGELNTDTIKQSSLTDENELYLAKAYLGILHNIVRLSSESRRLFRSSNAVKILQPYLHCPQGLVKIKAYMILSYIISEEENEIINANDDNIRFIISILEEAVNSENHFSKTYAFWATEIACGINHLAKNDSNKIRLASLGLLPLYVKLLQSDNVDEQSLGAAGLWILAFKDDNKDLIRDEPGCLEALQSLVNTSPNEGMRRSARGALWVIRSSPRKIVTQEVKDADVPHIMISYQWDAQKMMIKLRNRLKSAGFKVWMDIDNMTGSTLEAMALAVERAAVVLVCMSQQYKDSSSCRTEAEYTFRRQKDIVPILVQSGFVPDGWLGAMVGTRLHFDMTTEENLESQTCRLVKELGDRGRLKSASRSLISTPRSGRSEKDSEEGLCSLSSSTSSLHSYIRTPSAATWGPGEVKAWLEKNQLIHVCERFEKFSGDLLLQYKKMMSTAPEYFYNSLEAQLRFDLITSLRFAKSLESIS